MALLKTSAMITESSKKRGGTDYRSFLQHCAVRTCREISWLKPVRSFYGISQGSAVPALIALATWLVFGRLNAYLDESGQLHHISHLDAANCKPTSRSCPGRAARCCKCA